MEKLRHGCTRAFCLFAVLGMTLAGCQNAEYDAFRFGPDPGNDNSEAPSAAENIE